MKRINYHKSILSATLIGAAICIGGCNDDFTETNQSKDSVVTADPTYLFAQPFWNSSHPLTCYGLPMRPVFIIPYKQLFLPEVSLTMSSKGQKDRISKAFRY